MKTLIFSNSVHASPLRHKSPLSQTLDLFHVFPALSMTQNPLFMVLLSNIFCS